MNLIEYVQDSEWTVAKEIFNTELYSVEDAVKLMRKINKEKSEFDYAIHKFNNALFTIKACSNRIAKYENDLERLNKFKPYDTENISIYYKLIDNEKQLIKEMDIEKDKLRSKYGTLPFKVLLHRFNTLWLDDY